MSPKYLITIIIIIIIFDCYISKVPTIIIETSLDI